MVADCLTAHHAHLENLGGPQATGKGYSHVFIPILPSWTQVSWIQPALCVCMFVYFIPFTQTWRHTNFLLCIPTSWLE